MDLTPKEKLLAIVDAWLEAEISLNDWESDFITSLASRLEELEELQAEPDYTGAQEEQINKIYEKYQDSL